MSKSKKREHGVITILVSLMLTGILSLGTMVMEAGRLQSAKTQLNDANTSAGTSIIAAYDSYLYERYGLLAIDTDVATEGRYLDYLEFNSDLSVNYNGNNISTLYTIDSAKMEGMYNLTYPSVLKRQILSRAKYHIKPQDYAFNYYNVDSVIDDILGKCSYLIGVLEPPYISGAVEDIPADVKTALEKLYTVFSAINKYDENYDVTLTEDSRKKLPSADGTVKDNVPDEDIQAINNYVAHAQSVLGTQGALLASNGGTEYEENDNAFANVGFMSEISSLLSTAQTICDNSDTIVEKSHKMIENINNAINILNSDKEGNLLLNSYIAGYFSNKNQEIVGYLGAEKGTAVSNENDTNFAGACTEYFFSGNVSEKVNQESAYNYITAIRFVTNLYSTLQNSADYDRSNSTDLAVHIAWAYYESLLDTELLFRYNAVVPLLKYNMILPLNNPALVTSAFTKTDFMESMTVLGITEEDVDGNVKIKIEGADQTNYRDSLAMSLWLVKNSEKLLRIGDLIQLEMRYREAHVENKTPKFLMSEQNTFCRVECEAKMNFVLPVISLGSNSGIQGTKISSIKYVGY